MARGVTTGTGATMASPDIRPYALSPHQAGLRVVDGRIAMPEGVPRRRKVVIWGFGSPTVRRVPFDDPSFEVWSINNGWNVSRDREDRLRADVWFEQHGVTPDEVGPDAGQPIQDANDLKWIETCPVPIYLTEPHANPNAVVWPWRAMVAKGYRRYFTCTFAMQVCEALEVGFDEIHLFGLDLLLGTKREATVEAACLNYWLGLAEGRGVRVVVQSDELLLLRHPYVYGHHYWDERRFVESYVARWDDLPTAI